MAFTTEQLADFLRKWSKKKPIIKQGDSNFWGAGKYMTKIMPEEVDKLVAAGLAKVAGGRLVIEPKKKASKAGR